MGQAPVITEIKKKNVSTKGKKNWRKNIDTSEIDKKTIKNLDKKIIESRAKNLKNEDIFTMDIVPNESAKQKFRREFEEKKKKKGSESEKALNNSNFDHLMKVEEKKTDQIYDLWGDSNPSESLFKFPNSSTTTQSRISYPKIPLPHPGQSYNPDRK